MEENPKGGTMQNVVRIHRPDITPEERAKRMEGIKQAAARLIIAAHAAKKGRN